MSRDVSSSSSPTKSRFPVGIAALFALIGVGTGLLVSTLRSGSSAFAPSSSEVILTVNGVPIPRETFVHRLQIANGRPLIQQMTEEELVLQFAKKKEVSPTDADIEAKYAETAKQPGFEDNLKKSQQTPQDVKGAIRVQLAREAVIAKGVTVTDAEAKAFYERNTLKTNPKSLYYVPETVQIAAILTETEALAKAALGELAKSVPFAQVAQKYSRDASKTNGGVLPPLQKGRWDASKLPGLQEKVFAMKPGDQTPVVQIAGKWWVIRCLVHQSETTIPYEKVQDDCRKLARQEKGLQANAQTMNSEYEAFKRAAELKAVAPEYADFVAKP